ncbi:protein of unknown function [Filimonas lacunae]|uniref:DUF4292 domain-containing protein n=1 Tax=Filimonas lacunae TaxID=477680 RepID=A0A173MRK5_9BACT|nr:DUF4292 domain-containing protein [Filimonas lacunae]BAV10282.1 hypothetical protein FLA_6343 [Filimonas lacunae]SIT17514.1 protein of unknown function [Filimonas lacunae]
MKFLVYSATACLVLAVACRPAKKVQRIENAISKKDTVAKVVVKPEDVVDSMSLVQTEVKKLHNHKIPFTTFSGKVRVEYEDKDGGNQANANIQMQKDSAIWISLTGPFNIEGFRLLVTKDSVRLMNKIKKTVQFRSIEYLQELTQIPFDFYTLQDLIIGNPVFIDGKVHSYKNSDNGLQVLILGKLFKHLVTIDVPNQRVLHSKLDDVDSVRNRTCDITFDKYETNNDISFSTYRKISVAEHSRLDVSLEFKKYSFTDPVSFPFNIPKNFKKK